MSQEQAMSDVADARKKRAHSSPTPVPDPAILRTTVVPAKQLIPLTTPIAWELGRNGETEGRLDRLFTPPGRIGRRQDEVLSALLPAAQCPPDRLKRVI